MQQQTIEVSEGKRFGFGKNWNRFLSVLKDERISEAENSLREMLACEDLKGKNFLDIGSGSGLFSLAARRLGARVYSFDYDPQSVGCTAELKRRYFPDDSGWEIKEGSVLDEPFVRSLGQFDIVYSWGVLHHTGNMWRALGCSQLPVKEGGLCFIAIYNDQGPLSGFWKQVKRAYCSGARGKMATVAVFIPFLVAAGFVKDTLCLKNPLKRYTEYQKKSRGMSVFYDWLDWLGGYPFEVARPEDIVNFYEARGFGLLKMKTTKGWGNNQFVFKKTDKN
jgi:2-polyprenyl-6-hydroxyphenyl methylase/3-demethylubiquinone-9 3-methyltransferase